MRTHDDIGVIRRDDVGRHTDHIVQAGSRIAKGHFDLSSQNAAAPIYFRNREQRSIDACRSPDSCRSREPEEVDDSELLSIATLTGQLPTIGVVRRTWCS
jgi:hypothetical protein